MPLLKNKKVVITGASKGVGKAISCRFAREGAHLILVEAPECKDMCSQVEQQCTSEGAKAVDCFDADLSDRSSCNKLCEKLAGMNVDVLINNAGMFGPSGEEQGPLKGDPDQWDKMMSVNLKVPMCITRHVAPGMADRGDGFIINIGDVEGLHTGPHHPAYAASKHGLRGFSLSCYEALRDKGIKVVHLAPGNVQGTEMMEATSKGGEKQGAMRPEDVAEACMLPFRVSGNCVPSEIVLKAVHTGGVTA